MPSAEFGWDLDYWAVPTCRGKHAGLRILCKTVLRHSLSRPCPEYFMQLRRVEYTLHSPELKIFICVDVVFVLSASLSLRLPWSLISVITSFTHKKTQNQAFNKQTKILHYDRLAQAFSVNITPKTLMHE